MKILVLVHEYPPVGGGGGRVAQDLCVGLVERGHQVRLLTAQHGDLPEVEIQDGIQIFRLKSGRKVPYRADFSAMLGFVLASTREGLRQIRAERPDVIHVHFAVPAGVSAFLLSRLTKVPYVITAHLGDVPGGVPEKTKKWFRWVFPFTPAIWQQAAKIAAVSQFTRELALKSYDVPIEVIPNGVDLKSLDPGEITVNHPPKIVFAGRFTEQKNPIKMLACLAKVSDIPWHCTLIGDGPLRPAMEDAVEKANLGDRVSFLGWVKPERVIDQYRSADLMFMPSYSEGLPVVGVQALAMGLALVLSRAGGNVELVDNGVNGFLHDPDDTQGFVSALRELLTDPDRLLRFRKASREKSQQFTMSYVTKQYETLLEQAIQNQN